VAVSVRHDEDQLLVSPLVRVLCCRLIPSVTKVWRSLSAQARPSAAAGEDAPRQDIPVDWMRGVERLPRLPAYAGVPQHRWAPGAAT
jgi:hypothetical protein